MSISLALLAAWHQVNPRPSPPAAPQPSRRRAASTSSRRSVSSTYSPRLSSSRPAPAVVSGGLPESSNSPDASYFSSSSPGRTPPKSRLVSPGIAYIKSPAASPAAIEVAAFTSAAPPPSSAPSSSLSATATPFVPPLRRTPSNSSRSPSVHTSSRRASNASRSSVTSTNDGFTPRASAAPIVTTNTTTVDNSIGLGPAPTTRMSSTGTSTSSRASSVSETLVDGRVGAVGEMSGTSNGGKEGAALPKVKKTGSRTFSLPFSRRSASGKEASSAEGSAPTAGGGGTLGERLKRSLSKK